MSLELYIWGPAFGLASIEPECIAAVAYLKVNVPIDSWILLPDHGFSGSKPGRFPYLCDGDVTITGFEAIVRHLCKRKAQDNDLDSEKKADCTIFKAHLRATALPLIDIHLYLSSENNYHITRPAWTAILPWYANYCIPPIRRTAAKVRTQHLGLSGLDIDYDVSSSRPRPFTTIKERYENAKTAGLAGDAMAGGRGRSSDGGIATADTAREGNFVVSRQQKGNVRDMLIGSGSTTLFKLDSLAGACFGPLEKLLGDKELLISDTADDNNRPSSLDCLALGYLSLIVFPDMRKAFLADVLRTKYAKLYAYVLRLLEFIFGNQMVDVRAVMSLKDESLVCKSHESITSTSNYADMDSSLPWSSIKSRQSAYQTFKSNTLSIIHSIPLLNSVLPHSNDDTTLSSDPPQIHPSALSSSSAYDPSQPPSLFSSFLPLTTTIFTFFVSYATYAVLSEKADVNPHFRIERGAEWQQQQQQQQRNLTYDHNHVYNYSNAGTALGMMRHGMGGFFGGGIGRNMISARGERDMGRPTATGNAVDDVMAGDKTEASIAEIEADVKVEA